MLLAFCSRGSCRALPISFCTESCFRIYLIKWDTLGAVCPQLYAAIFQQNASITLFIKDGFSALTDLRPVFYANFLHRPSRDVAENALIFKIEYGRVSSGVPGMSLRV